MNASSPNNDHDAASEASNHNAPVATHAISVVVPVYQSAGSLPTLHSRLSTVLESVSACFEIILVEDGGTDSSWEMITALADADRRVRGIRLSRNYGQHNALLRGIRAARFPLIVTLDDDLQNPPEEIPTLLSAMSDDLDVIYGTPDVEQHGILRNLSSRITKIALQSAMGADTARYVSTFRLFRARLREGFDRYEGPYVSIDVLLTWSTSRFAHIRVRHEPRPIGRSNYGVRKLATHALNMMTGFSTLPLQLASVVGFVFTTFGAAVLTYVLVNFLLVGSLVPGFAFLASIVALFSGAQLFALGIIGEYIARMHFRSMDRPTYLVSEFAGDFADRAGSAESLEPALRQESSVAEVER